ncbi:hypothetical protein ACFFVB_17475 [Formosa undariae]|uniref:Uncharacterized protein n=1 Tax=Formosa undariae TaxID=1325436 RepID=A0ABV5F6Y1_9FLAO
MKRVLFFISFCFFISTSFAQEWLTSLDVGERLALVQNKLLVVVWENSYYDGASAYVNTSDGKRVFIEEMYESPEIDSLLWAHFVPVVLSENEYPRLYDEIKKTRSMGYIDKFHDESLKVMDSNGNIINTTQDMQLLNLSEFILKYSMDTSFLNSKMLNYKSEKNFYSAFYLASSYMDFAFFANNDVRPELVDLSAIYLDEASEFLKDDKSDNKPMLEQRVDLLEIQKELLLQDPKKVLRKLKRIKVSEVAKQNLNLRAFLYYSAYKMLQDEENASVWQSEVSLLDLKKINNIVSPTTED